MIINLITLKSCLEDDKSPLTTHRILLEELSKYFTINLIDITQLDTISQEEFSIIFIETGGVERIFSQYFERLPKPIVLLADGWDNSLASALEISSWIRMRGLKSEILHGDTSEIIKRLITLYSNFKAYRNLAKESIGVIGTTAPWLIASHVDYLLSKRRWGVTFRDISIDEIIDEYNRVTEDEIGEKSAFIASRAKACREGTPQDLLNAMRLYKAIKNVAEREHISALTISCFKIIESLGVTACLALALLNDEGIIAGCEGDLQAVFTMLVVKALTGKVSFMANPCLVDTKENSLVLGHCSIGLKQTEGFIIRNHFESGKGIAIQGILPKGEVTLLKCGGECLDEYYVSSGTLLENTEYPTLCRTQVRIKLENPVSYFLTSPLSNHHIMVHGNHAHLFNEFMQSNGCKRVE